MRVLVIFSHPASDSFSAALCKTAMETLNAAGHETRLTDLYEQGFDPVMHAGEWRRYADPAVNRDPVADHVDDLLWAEALLFIYPTWWYGLPAMLKGYLDRVWIPHVTFDIPTETSGTRPRMQHIRKIAVVTTCGASWLISKLVGEPGRKTVLRGIRLLCHPLCRVRYLAHYKMDTSTAESRARYLAKVKRSLASW
ncbi:NAD(P)H-dependent oxidoreductase [Stappia sp. P2PMeth1]|uniref:NAD(P)H-dependent oxidoreductase n=1 Tax=Stappia sp. P2PMeth1 TaxID=2003586 RepID=UPI001648843F|nr:NAD(P)H-dependent oxidoreductase [Stappia sp. P2PMeth1]